MGRPTATAVVPVPAGFIAATTVSREAGNEAETEKEGDGQEERVGEDDMDVQVDIDMDKSREEVDVDTGTATPTRDEAVWTSRTAPLVS